MSPHAKRRSDAASDSAALCVEDLASAHLLFRTEAEPRSKGGSVSELRHIGTDLAQDGLSCDRADPRHVGQVNAKDSIQLTPQVKTLRFVATPLVRGCFG